MTDTLDAARSYYIQATSALADPRTQVLKQGDTFAIFDLFGNMHGVGRHQMGLFHRGTRFLSLSALTLGTDRALLLSSTVPEDNARVRVDLTNPDIFRDGALV